MAPSDNRISIAGSNGCFNPSATDRADGIPRPPSTEKHLIYLAKTLIELCNARLYSHIFFSNHISTTIFNNFEGRTEIGKDIFIRNYRNVADESPLFSTNTFNETALVDEGRGIGSVLMSQDMSAFSSEGRRMAGTILFNWEKKGEFWVCVGVNMVYGTPQFLSI